VLIHGVLGKIVLAVAIDVLDYLGRSFFAPIVWKTSTYGLSPCIS
jgi:hypothetical protein